MDINTLQNDLAALASVLEAIQTFAPNAVSGELLAFFQFVEADPSILNFVSSLITAILPPHQKPPAPTPTPGA